MGWEINGEKRGSVLGDSYLERVIEGWYIVSK